MKYKFRAYEQDFMAYYMLNAINSPEIIKKRKNGFLKLLIITIAFIAYLSYSFFSDGTSRLLGLFCIYILFLLVYIVFFLNKRYKRHYEKHYQKHIENNIKSELGRITTIEIIEDKVHLEDESSESKFNISELDVIWETPKYYLPK